MRRIVSSLFVIGAVLALVVGAGTFALFTDVQNATGDVNAGTINLYLLDNGDDAGENEIIFENTENMLPGETVSWPLRLWNTGNRAWDVQSATFHVSETGDPGGDCNTHPTASVVSNQDSNDHGPAITQVHTEPNEVNHATVNATLDGSAGNECQGNTWSIQLVITVVQH